MANFSEPTPESEWRLLRQEAALLNAVMIALEAGGLAAALKAVDAVDPVDPVVPAPRSEPTRRAVHVAAD